MNYKAKALGFLIPLAIVDAVIPLPIIGLLLIYVILARPAWFSVIMDQVYGRILGTGSSGPTNGTDAS